MYVRTLKLLRTTEFSVPPSMGSNCIAVCIRTNQYAIYYVQVRAGMWCGTRQN